MSCNRTAAVGTVIACLLTASATMAADVTASREDSKAEVTVSRDGESVSLHVKARKEEMTQEAMYAISSMAGHQMDRFRGVDRVTLIRHYDATEMNRRKSRSRIVESKRDKADEPDILIRPEYAFAERYIVGKKGVKNFLVFGPYAKIPAGRYIVAFRLKPLERSGERFGSVGVAEKGESVTEVGLKPRDLIVGSWNVRGVRYEPDSKRKRVEFRVWQDKAPLAVDRVYLFRIGR